MIPLLLAVALNCGNSATQVDLDFCSEAAAQSAIKVEAAAYKAAAFGNSSRESRTRLRESEAAWRQYRRAQCDFMGAMAAGGSLEPMIDNDCWATLTRERATTLGWFAARTADAAPASASSAAEEASVYGKLEVLLSPAERALLADSERAWRRYRAIVCDQSRMRSCRTQLTLRRTAIVKSSWLADPFW